MTESHQQLDEQRGKARRTAAILGAVALVVYLGFLVSGIL